MSGRVFKYGNDVDTDVIFPARYLGLTDEAEIASHSMEDIDRNFASSVRKGDYIVAGDNFGCGSSREHAPLSIKAAGIRCVIAESFARIFYRNAINIGLAILECEDAVREICAGDEIDVDFESGVIRDITTGKEYKAEAFPPFIREIIEDGGLAMHVIKKSKEPKEEQER